MQDFELKTPTGWWSWNTERLFHYHYRSFVQEIHWSPEGPVTLVIMALFVSLIYLLLKQSRCQLIEIPERPCDITIISEARLFKQTHYDMFFNY